MNTSTQNAPGMTPVRSHSEIQALLRDEIAALRATLEERFAEIETLTGLLEKVEDTGDAQVRALELRHSVEKTLLHRYYTLAQHGPSEAVPALEKQTAALRDGDVMDAGWYLETYPDLKAAGVDPAEHYVTAGAFEGRNPGPGFDTMNYYLANRDVAESGWPAAVHYQMFGRAEGRALQPAG